MELSFVLLCVLLGTGAIVYAGLRRPAGPPVPAADETAPASGEEPSDVADDPPV